MNKFKVMVSDFPWPYNKLKVDATAEENSAVGFLNYASMSIEELKALKPYIDGVMDKDCLFFMWGTWPFLPDAIDIAEYWGFDYVTGAYVWVKTNRLPALDKLLKLLEAVVKGKSTIATVKQLLNVTPYFGMGRWTASNTEYCLLFKRGKPHFRNNLLSQIVLEETLVHPVMGHSRKPEDVQERIEQLYEGPYLELFARREKPKWVCLGNEVTGNDIRKDLESLKGEL